MRKLLNKGFVKLEGTLGDSLETAVFRFHVKAPIFIAKKWAMKSLGTFLEIESTEEEFYIPPTFVKNQLGGGFTEEECNALFTKIENYSKWSHNFSKKLISEGLTHDQANMLLPMNAFTSFYWTVSAKHLQFFIRSVGMTDSTELQLYRDALAEYQHLSHLK